MTSIACADAISTKRITINLKFLIDVTISLLGTVTTLLVFIDHSYLYVLLFVFSINMVFNQPCKAYMSSAQYLVVTFSCIKIDSLVTYNHLISFYWWPYDWYYNWQWFWKATSMLNIRMINTFGYLCNTSWTAPT